MGIGSAPFNLFRNLVRMEGSAYFIARFVNGQLTASPHGQPEVKTYLRDRPAKQSNGKKELGTNAWQTPDPLAGPCGARSSSYLPMLPR